MEDIWAKEMELLDFAGTYQLGGPLVLKGSLRSKNFPMIVAVDIHEHGRLKPYFGFVYGGRSTVGGRVQCY